MLLPSLIVTLSSLVPLSDVRVGDHGHVGRVEVECARACDVEMLDETRFAITGAAASFSVDARPHSAHLSALTFRQGRRGTVVEITPEGVPRAVSASRCGFRTWCFEFDMRAYQERHHPDVLGLAEMEASMGRLNAMFGLSPGRASAYASVGSSVTGCGVAVADLDQSPRDLAAYRAVLRCEEAGHVSLAQAGQKRRDWRRRFAVLASGFVAALRF